MKIVLLAIYINNCQITDGILKVDTIQDEPSDQVFINEDLLNSIFNGPESDLDEGISEIEQSSEIDEIIKELEASNDNSAVIRLDTEQDDPIIDQNIVLQLDAENERDVDSLLPVLQSASQAGSGPIVVINIRFLHLLKL